MNLVSRLRPIVAAGLALVLAACALPQTEASAPAPEVAEVPPNIIWIIADDQAYADFGFMGHDVIKTPNLDKLAAESAVFPNGYVPSSLCRASLATLITGKYAFDHGICFNDPPQGIAHADTFRFLQMQTPIPMELKQQGYRSLQTGKFWEGIYTNGGFTDGMTQGRRHGDEGLKIGRVTMEPIDTFIGNSGKDPFFIWFAPYLPHAPFDANERFRKPYEDMGLDDRTVGYYANIAWLDETIGQLMELLEKHDAMDNTVIMFVVDNGWAVKEEGATYKDLNGRNIPFHRRSKQSPYENGVRTPIMVKWPGRIAPGRYDNLVSSIDFYPTTLAVAQADQRPELPGLNLLPFLTKEATLAPRTVFGDIYLHSAVELDNPGINTTHRWARKGDWKLIIHDFDKGKAELFNLRDDPLEKNDLAADPAQAGRVAAMRAEIEAWRSIKPSPQT